MFEQIYDMNEDLVLYENYELLHDQIIESCFKQKVWLFLVLFN